MTATGRWLIAILVLFAGLATVFALELREPAVKPAEPGPAPTVDQQALAAARADARLPSCPAGTGEVPGLRGVVVGCAADGESFDAGARLGLGVPVLLNLWAYWCGPCAQELPALAEYQRRVGGDVAVVTVHQDRNEAAGVARLAELGVALPTLQDSERRIAAALGVPNVMPATVVLRADGTVAKILPRDFTSADQIAAAVDDALR
ncbi:TlpA family protein disulfide reductase [Mycolicibacterium brumae]|uniref:TlpA family protein disulfide reductase n=1 Tax=Mycolicibacterium brumae TaxID=85968 RepID=A0A2G5P9U8_9MYCO|nr:TlpA disulfide reductase family protein [Mycolicibacterium brumae]MCV7193353.1 TlpA family protein disulfide reductase [Mycolicibacterium brumae]PIB74763.1 TlpA family protein disulfide reductase [Mycolicibacterium brumae]RWA22216.1 hypothetical protein MBRU_13060 [Mycolicibacterium brumae DSM 44177]UWW07279.1 TlpA family protein disulfide reductase [Mycolicibacterium brumae]